MGEIHLIAPIYQKENYRTVRMAIGNLPPISDGEESQYDSLHRASKLSAINKERIKQSVPGGTWRDWDETLRASCHYKKTGTTFPSVYGRMKWDEPSPTITTQFYGYGNGRFGHPEQNRALTVRECARLQSFPDSYDFVGGPYLVAHDDRIQQDKYEQIGDAVPPLLAYAWGKKISNILKK